MIKIDLADKSSKFYLDVTVRGRKYLSEHPEAKGRLLPDIWNKCRDEVYRKYHGICAYLAIYLVEASGYEVDHFVPKSKRVDLAYEWDNLRLSSPRMNKKKWAHTIADPVMLPVAAMRVNFFTGRVSLLPSLPNKERELLLKTIQTLELNSPEVRKTRTDAYVRYKRDHLSVELLTRTYPFAAFEMMRQHHLREEDEARCVEILESIGFKSCASWLRIHMNG